MRIDYYLKDNSSNDSELFKTDYITYDTSNLNIDNIRFFLINLFDENFMNTQYKIKINQKIEGTRKTIISVFFEPNKNIKRNLQINKVLK